MAEYEELRLTVTLIDNASQGLATLRQNLLALGGNENREALTRMQREVEGLGERMGRTRDQMARTSGVAQTLGRTISTAATTFATAFVSHFAIDALRKFTDEMVRLDGTAKQFGVGGATIKNIVDQMKLMGIEGGAAQNLVTNFTTSLAEMSRQGSRIRQELMKGAVSDPAAMAAFISRITGFASRGEMENALNEVVEAANNAFQAELARTGGNEIMAAENRNRFLKTLGLDDATMAMIQGRFTQTTEAQKEAYAQRSAISQAFSKEWNEMDAKSRQFITGLQEGLLPLIRELNSLVGQTSESLGKAVGEGFGQFGKDVAEFIATIKLFQEGKWAEALKRSLGIRWKTEEEKAAERRATEEWHGIGVEQEGNAPRLELPPPAPPPPPLPPGVGDPRTNPMLQRMSYGGGGYGSSEMPPVIKASLGGAPIRVPGGDDGGGYSSGGAQSQFTRAIRTGTFDALVDFRNFMQAGGGGSPGSGSGTGSGDSPGVMKASLTTNSPTGPPSSVQRPPPSNAPSSIPTNAPSDQPPPGGAPGGGAAVPAFSPAVNAAIERAATDAGVDRSVLNRFASIESSGNPARVTGSYKGLFQLSQSEFQKYGGGNILDPGDNARAAAKKLAAESQQFEQKFGRKPEGHELYMVHQQGWGGMQAHLANPDQPAWKSMAETTEGRKKGEAWAKKAIWGNLTPEAKAHFGNVENVTSKGFTDFWRKRYENMPGGAKPPGSSPGQTRVARADQALRDQPDDFDARNSLDADLGKEIKSRVEASGSVTVDVNGGEQTKSESRKKLFTKFMTPRPRQMQPAELGPAAGDENGVSI